MAGRLTTAVVAGALALAATANTAHAQGVDTTCALPLTKTDPATVNVAYPDEAAIYWSTAYQTIPGMRLRITGRYPHARYFSFNVYDAAQRPLDALADVEIRPDAGSTDPFDAGAARTAAKRDWTAFVDFGPIPEHRAANTLYTGTGQTPAPNTGGTLILRLYVPDKGRDETGGVGLPTVTLEPTSATAARPADSPCSGVSKPAVGGVNDQVAALSPPAPPGALQFPGRNPPHWTKFKNLVQVLGKFATDNPLLEAFAPVADAAQPLGGNGAFLSNVHNSYVFTSVNRAYGDVSLTTVRAPSFPDTRGGAVTMPPAQLRYFSMCTNDFATQRFIACRTDDQSVVGDDGRIAYVVSPPAARPRWATADCGYTWLPFGPSNASSLIFRHMLPAPDFAQSIQRAEPGRETATMGDYLPSTRFVAGTETPACRAPLGTTAASAGPSRGLPSSTPPKACTSRRRIVLRLPRTLRAATVYVAGRRVASRRGTRLRVPVDLRGLPRGSYRVRIVGRTKAGRRVVTVRTYRTCARRT